MWRSVVVISVAAVWMSQGLSGCSWPGKPGDSSLDCPEIAPEQRGSYMPPLEEHQPVHVLIDPRFSSEQHEVISRAVEKWNSFSQASLHRSFFETAIVSDPGEGASLDGKGSDICPLITESSESFRIVREDSEDTWKEFGLKKNNPGVTFRCSSGTALTKQIILINPQYAIREQFMSIILHELGHSVGLNHSCSGNPGVSDYLSCDQVMRPEHPFHRAIMFPKLGSDEIKEDLRSNDKERANCLYRNR